MNITREEADLIFAAEGEQIDCFYSIQKYIAISYTQCEVYCEEHNLSPKDILKWCKESDERKLYNSVKLGEVELTEEILIKILESCVSVSPNEKYIYSDLDLYVHEEELEKMSNLCSEGKLKECFDMIVC